MMGCTHAVSVLLPRQVEGLPQEECPWYRHWSTELAEEMHQKHATKHNLHYLHAFLVSYSVSRP